MGTQAQNRTAAKHRWLDRRGWRQYTFSISPFLMQRLQLAGERSGITNNSQLVQMAILHYLQSCAAWTAPVKAGQVAIQVPPANDAIDPSELNPEPENT